MVSFIPTNNEVYFLGYSIVILIIGWIVFGRFTRSRMVNSMAFNLILISWVTTWGILTLSELTFFEAGPVGRDEAQSFAVQITIFVGIWIILFTLIYKNRISRPLKQIISQTDKMADGDLSSETILDLKGMGETASLLHSNRVLSNRFRTIVSNIKKSAQELGNAAEELASGSEEVAATTEEVTGTIQTIAEGAAEQVRRLDEVSRILSEMVNVTEDSIRQIGVTAEITLDLAEQTSLVSLNAAIEAAKAGVEGLGFHVVAEHVRRLSVESKTASTTVTSITQEISNRMRDSVFKIVGAVDKIATVAENTAASSEEAAAAAEEQAASLQEITRQAQKLSEMSDSSERNIAEFKV